MTLGRYALGPNAISAMLLALVLGVAYIKWERLSSAPGSASDFVDISTRDFRITTDGSATVGPDTSPVVLVEFSDFQCPFCRRHALIVLPTLLGRYAESGDLQYVFKNFPLSTIHPQAMRAAKAGACAGRQRAFWPMHSLLFNNQRAMSESDIRGHAISANLNMTAFVECLGGPSPIEIEKDRMAATKLNVVATPTFFLGVRLADKTVRLRFRIDGARTLEVFDQAIAALSAESSGARRRDGLVD